MFILNKLRKIIAPSCFVRSHLECRTPLLIPHLRSMWSIRRKWPGWRDSELCHKRNDRRTQNTSSGRRGRPHITWWILEGLFSWRVGSILWSPSEQSQGQWEGDAEKRPWAVRAIQRQNGWPQEVICQSSSSPSVCSSLEKIQASDE